MASSSFDPGDWSVDDVVGYLCNERTLRGFAPASSLPNLQVLERDLRAIDVDGFALLDGVDTAVMKDELNIKSLSHRSLLTKIIVHLRTQSARYIDYKRDIATLERSINDRVNTRSPALTPLSTLHPQHPPTTLVSPVPTILPSTEEPSVPPAKRRKRVQVQTIAQDPNNQPYLSRKGLPIDAVFYHDAGEHGELDLSIDSEENFNITRPASSVPGIQHVLRRRLQYFFQASPTEVDSQTTVRSPYPHRLVSKGKGKSTTLLKSTQDGVDARRVDETMICQSTANVDLDPDVNNHEWDFLLRKHTSTDVELPAYGDSGDEGDYAESLLDEIEAENLEPPRNQKTLSLEEVNTIMDDKIAAYQQQWQSQRQHSWLKKARRLWKATRNTSVHISHTSHHIDRLSRRLEKLRDGISKDEWLRSEPLQKQCGALQPTVFELCDLNYRLGIIRSKTIPARSDDARQPMVKPASLDSDSEGENILESDDGSDTLSDSESQVVIESIAQQDDQMSIHSVERSDSEDSVIGPLSTPPTKEKSTPFPKPDLTDLDVAKAKGWAELQATKDRERMMLKILSEMEGGHRLKIYKLLQKLDTVSEAQETFKATTEAMEQDDADLPTHSHEGFFYDVMLSRLFICWAFIQGEFRRNDTDIPPHIIKFARSNLPLNFPKFRGYVLSTQELLEDEEDQKPVKKVLQSKIGQQLRKNARSRRDEHKQRSEKFKLKLSQEQQFADSGDYQSNPGQVIVNPGKEDLMPGIYINNHLSSIMKDHQVEGVQFMWREIVASGEGELAQGCLLSHTMGLGKTMQAIALVATIAEACNSDDQEIVAQIPRDLKRLQTLVLAPAGLVTNWALELQKWLPEENHPGGPVYDLSKCSSVADKYSARYSMIRRWNTTGGILLASYRTFQNIVFLEVSEDRADDHEQLKKWLLECPSLIIADEAHYLKNPSSSISKAAHLFTSTRRVALTGSPLANNLAEYYSMINWVAPDFLGDRKEFSDYYSRPIEAGIHADSTRAEQRRSMKKLHALKEAISDKVHRADISVLQGDLKQKTEFVLKLESSDIQKELYSLLVDDFLTNKKAGESTITILAQLKTLALVCTHPHALLSGLAKTKKGTGKKSKGAARASSGDNSDDAQQSDHEPTTFTGISLDKELALRQFFEASNKGDPLAPQHSSKADVILTLLQHIKALGDQALVFSHRLPTLDYLQASISKFLPDVKMLRLDGSTDVGDRAGLVQEFNEHHDVFLISTTAGGLGLNITGANRVILVDFDWNPQNEEQAIGRAYRLGQKKPVFVYHLVTGDTFEEPLHHQAIFKQQLASRVVDKKNPTRSSLKLSDWIFRPKPLEQEQLEEFRGKDAVLDHLLDNNLMIRKLTTTETLHQEGEDNLTPEEILEAQQMIKDDHLRLRDHDEWIRKNGYPYSLANSMSSRPVLSSERKTLLAPAQIPGLPLAPGSYRPPGLIQSLAPAQTSVPDRSQTQAPLAQALPRHALPIQAPPAQAPPAQAPPVQAPPVQAPTAPAPTAQVALAQSQILASQTRPAQTAPAQASPLQAQSSIATPLQVPERSASTSTHLERPISPPPFDNSRHHQTAQQQLDNIIRTATNVPASRPANMEPINVSSDDEADYPPPLMSRKVPNRPSLDASNLGQALTDAANSRGGRSDVNGARPILRRGGFMGTGRATIPTTPSPSPSTSNHRTNSGPGDASLRGSQYHHGNNQHHPASGLVARHIYADSPQNRGSPPSRRPPSIYPVRGRPSQGHALPPRPPPSRPPPTEPAAARRGGPRRGGHGMFSSR